MNNGTPDQQCKLVLVGNGSVGKTSIISRFTADGFQRVYRQTIGVDFFEKRIVVKGDNVRVKMQVWDIGGQSLNSKMLPQYLSGAQVVFLCYDFTDRQSFVDLDDWLALVKRAFQDKATGQPARMPAIHLVGNKADLITLRMVSENAHNEYIADNALDGGFVCSAATGDHVLRGFYKAAAGVAGVTLTEYDLGFLDRAVGIASPAAQGAAGGQEGGDAADGGRTPWADQIEAEDRALEEAKARRAAKRGCTCM